jgi:short-subunit dehydrogenase
MENKIYALVTGASSGLGKAVAPCLAQNGYTLFAGIRMEADGHIFISQQNIIPIILDITNPQDIDNAYRFVRDKTKATGLAVLINNAGVNYISPFELADENTERNLMEVNLFGAMNLTRKLLSLLHQHASEARSSAKIINISSIGGVFGLPWEAAYHASKFAMIGFSQSLRYELEHLNISVCCFVPGGMKTNNFKKSIDNSEEAVQNQTHYAFYQRNLQHMKTVMHRFDKSAALPEKAAHSIARLLKQNRLPEKKYFGTDAAFIRILTRLGLQGFLKNLFTIK